MDTKALKQINKIIDEAENKKSDYVKQPKHDKEFAHGMETIISFIRKRLLGVLGGSDDKDE